MRAGHVFWKLNTTETVGDLLSLGRKKLEERHGADPKAFAELERALEKFGLTLPE